MLLSASNATSTNCTIKETQFQIKASPVAFEILSNKLYSNAILAVIRELLTNAYDAQKVIGKENVPIDIKLPSPLDHNFYIRDYGTGLSEEQIYSLYTTFFGSDKCNDNNLTGGFGLGSKAPFAYTSMFEVTSYYNHVEYKYIIMKKNGYPSSIKISEKDTEEMNGLKVSFTVNEKDNANFFNELDGYLKFIPEIKVNTFDTSIQRGELLYTFGNLKVYKEYSNEYISNRSFIFLKQGQNIYDVTKFATKTLPSGLDYKIRDNLILVYEVPIGTVSITPSREHITEDKSNMKLMETITKKIINSFNKNLYSIFKELYHKDYSKCSASHIHGYMTLLEIIGDRFFRENVNEIAHDNWRRIISAYYDDVETHKVIVRFQPEDCNTTYTYSKFEYRGVEKNGTAFISCYSKTYLVLYDPNEYALENTIFNKLYNINENYNFEADNIHIVAKSIPTDRDGISTSKRFYYKVKNIVFLASELLEMDIEIISFKNFLRLYPNYKKKKTVIRHKARVKMSRITYRNKNDDCVHSYVPNYNTHFCYTDIRMLDENTVLEERRDSVAFIPYKQDGDSITHFCNEINLMSLFKDENNHSILDNILFKEWGLEAITGEVTFILISEQYIATVKNLGYKLIHWSMVKDKFQLIPKTIFINNNEGANEIGPRYINFYYHFNEVLSTLTPKEKKCIQNTSFYKKLTYLRNTLCTPFINTFTNSMIEFYGEHLGNYTIKKDNVYDLAIKLYNQKGEDVEKFMKVVSKSSAFTTKGIKQYLRNHSCRDHYLEFMSYFGGKHVLFR